MLITNIQRFSLHDGDGIRTVVFLKGCNLNCRWCHNPETISKEKQVLFRKSKCIQCRSCDNACKKLNGNFIILDNIPEIDVSCMSCLKCAASCPTEAMEILGKDYSIDDLYDVLIRDKEFYDQSNGGVTFSGGEPLLQAYDLVPLMQKLRNDNISICIDTAGYVSWESFQIVLPYVRNFLFDIKCMDDELHISGTGASNALILDNFKKLYAAGGRIIVRIPVIPGFNADESNIRKIAGFIENYPNIENVELMPFHATAFHKYAEMDIKNDFASHNSMDAKSDLMRCFNAMF